jgi:hypothetical protein
MIHQSATPQPHLVARSIPRTRRSLTISGGLGAFLAAAIGLAPAASATHVPPGPPVAPPAPPPPTAITTMAAHFPLWAVTAIVAATVVLSVATTLVTLAIEHMHRARRASAAMAQPQAGVGTPSATAAPEAEPATSSALTHSPDSHL